MKKQPMQNVRAWTAAAMSMSTATTPAAAVMRAADNKSARGRPSAARTSATRGRTAAARAQARPHPATGRPVTRWIVLASAPSHRRAQASGSERAQEVAPPARASTSSPHRKSETSAAPPPSAARAARDAGLGGKAVGGPGFVMSFAPAFSSGGGD